MKKEINTENVMTIGDLEYFVFKLSQIGNQNFKNTKLNLSISKTLKSCTAYLNGQFKKPKNTKFEKLNTDYNKKRIKLCEEYAERDENNQFVIENGNFKIKESYLEEFNQKIEELKVEFKEYFDIMEDQKSKEDKIRKKKISNFDILLHKIRETDLPKDLTMEQLNVIEPMIIFKKGF